MVEMEELSRDRATRAVEYGLEGLCLLLLLRLVLDDMEVCFMSLMFSMS
jgi:hypothetical protein